MYIKQVFTSNNSVGNGPSPTLVVYALTTPITSPILDGGKPRPVQTPPILQFDDVTYGYVPINFLKLFNYFIHYETNILDINDVITKINI